MMARPLQFHWANTPHVLSISGTDFGVYGQLDVVKPNDTQHLLFLIEGATVAEFEAAWERQRGNWLELFRSPEGETVFRAMRVIRTAKWELTWNVIHCDDKPYDSLSVVVLK